MSAEILQGQGEEIDPAMAQRVGGTVFEKLAVDAATAIEGSELMSSELANSVTRLGDGQTVPDER